MKKPHLSIDDAFEDYGFSAVSSEMASPELEKQKREVEELRIKLIELRKQNESLNKGMNSMYRLIIPFLNKLKENPECDHIRWPNRVEHIEKFRTKIENLFDEIE